MDPITVIATASAAYNAIKKGVAIGRELQDMGGQLAQWAGAVSDLEFLAKKAEQPPWWKIGSNVQAEAIEIFAAKKRIEAQRERKQATDHRKAEMKELAITIILVILVLLAGVAGLALLAYLLWASQQ